MDTVRYNGIWYKINARQYEPEKQTHTVAWNQILNPTLSPTMIYKNYFDKQREEAKVLYPSFRKENAD
jgi:hypothetical protein